MAKPLNIGGWGPELRSDADIQALVDNNPQMISLVRAALNDQDLQVTSLTYRSQRVAGMNYVVKVRIQSSETQYALLRIYQPLPGQGQLELVKCKVIQPIPTE
ncbi:cystatin-A2-like [Mytilus trossulus]|uniref:cystatin-A2-like n=1 Tax=Mytilus trossulus TaxID=6551 RepID=UPI003006BADF